MPYVPNPGNALSVFPSFNLNGLSSTPFNVRKNFTLNGSSYAVQIGVAQTGAVFSTGNVIGARLSWMTDNTFTTVLNKQDYYFYPGASSSLHNLSITGPTETPYLQLFIFENNLTFTVAGTSNAIVRDSNLVRSKHLGITQTVPSSWGTGSNTLANLMAAGILCDDHVSVGISATTQFVLPLWTGQISFCGSTSSRTNDAEFLFQDLSSSVGTATLTSIPSAGAGFTPIIENMNLPRSQMTLNLNNNNAAAQTLFAMAICNTLV